MTEEVSNQMQIAVTVTFIAGLLGTVLGIFVMGLGILNAFNDRFTTTVAGTNTIGLASISTQAKVSGPTAYTAIMDAEGSLDKVTLVKTDGSSITLYDYKVPGDSLIVLMTEYRTSNVRVSCQKSPMGSGMYVVTVTEVD